jgi:hypothetical protein
MIHGWSKKDGVAGGGRVHVHFARASNRGRIEESADVKGVIRPRVRSPNRMTAWYVALPDLSMYR